MITATRVPAVGRSVAAKTRRPAWVAGEPLLEFDCRGDQGLGDNLTGILHSAETVRPGRYFTIRVTQHPNLLCHIFSSRGYHHWVEDAGEQGFKAHFSPILF